MFANVCGCCLVVIVKFHIGVQGRSCGLVASALDSESAAQVRALAEAYACCIVFGRDTLLPQCFEVSTQGNKWVQTGKQA